MSDTNWREVLKAQQEDLKALQRNSNTSDDEDLDADIDRVLRRPVAPTWLKKSAKDIDDDDTNDQHEALNYGSIEAFPSSTSSSKPTS